MNEVDRWIYFDGPEPEQLRGLLDALRDLPPATPEDKERVTSSFFERLDAMLLRASERRSAEGTEPSPEAVPSPEEGARASTGLTGTAMALDLPAAVWEAAGKLPFLPAPPGQAAPGQRLAQTMRVPVMPGLGDTVPIGDDSITKAVAALPFAGSAVGAGLVSFPRLKLEEYASLCAELTVQPERSAEILRRYHVLSKAAHGALDEHWREHLAAHPETRAAFERALAAYTAWLREQQR